MGGQPLPLLPVLDTYSFAPTTIALVMFLVTFHRQGLVKKLWPSPSRFYRAALRWVFCPKAATLEEDAQSAQKLVRGGSGINQSTTNQPINNHTNQQSHRAAIISHQAAITPIIKLDRTDPVDIVGCTSRSRPTCAAVVLCRDSLFSLPFPLREFMGRTRW